MKPAFVLSDDVHLCELSDAIIVLDARRNKYSLFADDQVRWFTEILRSSSDEAVSEKAQQFALRLQRNGLVERYESTSKPRTISNKSPRPTVCIHGQLESPSLSASIRWVPGLLSSLQYARKLIHGTDFYATLQSLRSSKPATNPHFVKSNSDAVTVAQAFSSLAPYFVTLKDACLFRSIALFRLLHFCGLAGTVNFGVRLCPFTAHCWVQADSVVLNDELDDVLEFNKILVV